MDKETGARLGDLVDEKEQRIRELIAQAAGIEKEDLDDDSSKRDLLRRHENLDAVSSELDAYDHRKKTRNRELQGVRERLRHAQAELAELKAKHADARAAEEAAQHQQAFEQELKLAHEDGEKIGRLLLELTTRIDVFEDRRFRIETLFADRNGLAASRGLVASIGLPRGDVYQTLKSRGWRLPKPLPSSTMLSFTRIVGMRPPADGAVDAESITSLEELAAANEEERAQREPDAGGRILSEEASQAAGYGAERPDGASTFWPKKEGLGDFKG